MSATPEGMKMTGSGLYDAIWGRGASSYADATSLQSYHRLSRAIAAHVAARVGEVSQRIPVDQATMNTLDRCQNMAWECEQPLSRDDWQLLTCLIARCYVPEARDGE